MYVNRTYTVHIIYDRSKPSHYSGYFFVSIAQSPHGNQGGGGVLLARNAIVVGHQTPTPEIMPGQSDRAELAPSQAAIHKDNTSCQLSLLWYVHTQGAYPFKCMPESLAFNRSIPTIQWLDNTERLNAVFFRKVQAAFHNG